MGSEHLSPPAKDPPCEDSLIRRPEALGYKPIQYPVIGKRQEDYFLLSLDVDP